MTVPGVPTNVRDLDSFIVERFCTIRDERERFGEADQTPEQIKEILDMVASVGIGGSIEAACENANVEYARTGLYELKGTAAAEYVYSFGSGPDRRSVLYRLFADTRDIIAKLPKIPSVEIMNKMSTFKIDDEAMALINKTIRKGHDIATKYTKTNYNP